MFCIIGLLCLFLQNVAIFGLDVFTMQCAKEMEEINQNAHLNFFVVFGRQMSMVMEYPSLGGKKKKRK